ncbi:DUF4192 domain-containing protein [Kitasatospora azatica]|uniref:DUF4192 domain-containing protein n=1 Tax=Kitasatospora azatica TaxID=58347 RepID=UPI0006895F2D|nr:DUF4192 domain-containing protein [Kitasatospora azatica]
MTRNDPTPIGRPSEYQLLRMRGPADMAAMLPYLLGFYPDDSIVAVGLHGPMLQQGGAIRLDIPDDPQHWPLVAAEIAQTLVELSEQRVGRPEAVLLYLCRDPEPDGPPIVSALRPLADRLLQAFREADVPVKESLCVSAGRWWSFLCSDPACCTPEGVPVYTGRDTRAVVAAATFAGLAPRGSRKAIAAALTPVGPPRSDAQRQALERQMTGLVKELAEPDGPLRVLEATTALIEQAMVDFRSGAPQLDDERAARLIIGLQDRVGRDRGAEYAEADELAGAQRLWRFLIRRCVAPYEEYAKAPLTLLAWTAWLAGDIATSRVALGKALSLDPDYTLAELLYLSLNGGMAPDGLLEIIRTERARRAAAEAECGAGQPDDDGGKSSASLPDDPPSAEPFTVEPPKPPAARSRTASPGNGSRTRGARGRRAPQAPESAARPAPGAHDSADPPPAPTWPNSAANRNLIPPQRRGGGSQPPQSPVARAPQPDAGTPTPPDGRTAPPSTTPVPGRFARLTRRANRRTPRNTHDSTIGS